VAGGVAMKDVFFFEAFEEEAALIRACLPPGLSAEFTGRTIQEWGDRETAPASVISIRTQSEVPLAWAARGMRALLSRSTGYDHVSAYRARVAPLAPAFGCLPLYCARAVAEQAALLWMALLRKLPQQVRQFRTFHRDGLTGGEIAGRTLLVVGVGNIGGEVVRIGRGLGMCVLGVDLVKPKVDVELVALDAGLPRADVVVCAMDLTPANRGYFGYERLARMKPGAVFVNVARGEFAPAADLLRALDEGRLGGVAMDVYEDEKELAVSLRAGAPSLREGVRATLQLASRENVICTPHNAFNTVESVERKARQSVEQVQFFLKEGRFFWRVPEPQSA
jgi:D-lactate dehydrogenase